MRKIILVRHSLPQIIPEEPARQWHLSEIGRKRCAGLAERLRPHQPARIITSTESKAIETGQLVATSIGVPWMSAEDLHEHDRSNVGFLPTEQFGARVARFFDQPGQLVFGRETADRVHERFAGMIADLIQQHPEGNLAIVAHGTVIALFVSRAAGLEPLPLWKRLGLPSFIVLSLPGPQVVGIVEGIEG